MAPAPIVTAGCGVCVARAALRDERVVQRDAVHRARPDQQRVGGIGRALVAVAAAFDDQPQMLFAREVDGGNDVFGLAAATAYALGADVHASTQPEVCVKAG